MKKMMKIMTAIFVIVSLCVACSRTDKENTSQKTERKIGNAQRLGWENPFNIIDISPVYEKKGDGGNVYYSFERLKIQTPDGELMYDDKQMNDVMLYMHYFFMSYMIASGGTNYATYLEDHLFEVVYNLPLDKSYPQDIREYANFVYYSYKDKMQRMIEYEKGDGYVEYAYDQGGLLWGDTNVDCFKLYKEKDTGRLMLDLTMHDFITRQEY